eukprot:scaffold1256_cov150-Skeletonema_menzelii.AAC.16
MGLLGAVLSAEIHLISLQPPFTFCTHVVVVSPDKHEVLAELANYYLTPAEALANTRIGAESSIYF